MTATELTTAIILGIVLIFTILIRRSHINVKSKKIAREKALIAATIIDNKLELTETENINGYLIGIDKINFLLLYLNFMEEGSAPVLFDLWEIKKAELIIEDESRFEVKNGNRVLGEKQVSKLKIKIAFSGDQPDQEIILYEYRNALEDYVVIKKSAAYWCRLINEITREISSSAGQKSNYA